MQKRLFVCGIALLLIFLSGLLIISPSSLALAHSIQKVAMVGTPTPDANAILNQANAAATQAANTATKADHDVAIAQATLNAVNLVGVDFSIFLAVLSLIVAIIGVLGSFTIAELRKNLNAAKKAREEIEKEAQTVTSAVKNTQRAVTYLILGNDQWQKKKIDQAIISYKKALELRQDDDPQINYYLGRAYSNLGFYEQAIDCLEKAIKGESKLAQAYMELGLVYRRQADGLYADNKEKHDELYNKALINLETAKNLLPKYDDALSALGGLYRRWKKYSIALDYYEQARDANPKDSYAAGNIAILKYYLHGLQEAYQDLVQTIDVAEKRIKAGDPEDLYWAYYDMGMAKLILGDETERGYKKQAMEAYHSAIPSTLTSKNFQSVLDVLLLLRETEDKWKRPIDGLKEVIKEIQDAQKDAEGKEQDKKAGLQTAITTSTLSS